MPAPIGSQNAIKWTVEKVTENLEKIKKEVIETDVLYIGEALGRLGTTRKAWSYWKKIFARYEGLLEQMELIEQLFEAKLFRGAMKEGLSIPMSIFALKNNHRWTDKPEPEHDPKQSTGMIIKLSDDTIVLVDVQGVSGTFKQLSEH